MQVVRVILHCVGEVPVGWLGFALFGFGLFGFELFGFGFAAGVGFGTVAVVGFGLDAVAAKATQYLVPPTFEQV